MYETIGRTQIRCYTVSTIKDKEYYLTTIWHRFYGRPVVVAKTKTRTEAINTHREYVRFCARYPREAYDIEINRVVELC